MNLLNEYIVASQSLPVLRNRSYVTEVLGIYVPLNESYPYSIDLQSKIIYEQMLLEGFWDDLKSMKATTKNLFAAFKKVSTSPETVKSLSNHFSKAVRYARKQLFTLLNSIIEKLGEYNMPTFKSWAEKLKSSLTKILKAPDEMGGWKGALSQAGISMAIKYLWDQIGDTVVAINKGIKDFLKLVAEGLAGEKLEEAVEKLKEFLKEKVIEKISPVIKEKLLAVSSKLMAQFSGVGAWFDAAKTAFDGSKFVLDFLKIPLSKFMTKLKAEGLFRKYIREILTEGKGMAVFEDLPSGIVITVEESGFETAIYYDSVSNPGNTDIYPFGRITIEAPWPEGTCDGAWNVSRADADQGWGPLLYDIAIEWATQNANGLMSDRASVDEEAISIWDKYISLGRAKVHQVGNENCDQGVAEEDKGSDWKGSSLSKRYTRPPTTIDALKATGRWNER